jgi:hypothetical protein
VKKVFWILIVGAALSAAMAAGLGRADTLAPTVEGR